MHDIRFSPEVGNINSIGQALCKFNVSEVSPEGAQSKLKVKKHHCEDKE